MIEITETSFRSKFDDELLIVEAWGENSVRVRSFPDMKAYERLNALQKINVSTSKIKSTRTDDGAELVNGKIRVTLDHRNRLTFYNNQNEVLLQEYIRLRAVKHDDGSEDVGTVEITKDFNSTLKLKAREYLSTGGNTFKTTVRFESNPNEKIFGMGQYQQTFLDLKNTTLELAQRNSQISIPFYVSSLGYGFLWNNPGIGEVTFSKNITRWKMYATNYIDYWVTAGDQPKEILRNYTNVTGKAPMMPDRLLNLWQSKLRYRNTSEVLDVVDKYKEKGIQLSAIVIDYFHWTKQGEYKFDEEYWPNPEKMVNTLKSKYGVEPIVSIWPTVQTDASNYKEYAENGFLVKTNRGVKMTMQIQGNTNFIDMTNPEARDYVRDLIKKNYERKGISYFWLDVAEPGYAVYDFDNYRYYAGQDLECGNIYPLDYLKVVTDKKTDPVALVRGGWAGVQKYGALLWSGDIDSSFEAFRNQINTGLNVGMAGVPWWTTDIGGFHGGFPEDPEFRELLVRWFEYATFSPILRMHGDRNPHKKPLSDHGGGSMVTGAPNEIWSYGNEVEIILTKYLKIRSALKAYISVLMKQAHEQGDPLMRPLFYEYPNDGEAWNTDNTYLFGSDIVVAPIVNYQQRSRDVYLPAGTEWINLWTGDRLNGGSHYDINAEIDEIPVFINSANSELLNSLLTSLKGE